MSLRHKYWITLDYLDGTTKVRGPLYVDEIQTFGMLLSLNEANVVSMTISRSDPLNRITAAVTPCSTSS